MILLYLTLILEISKLLSFNFLLRHLFRCCLYNGRTYTSSIISKSEVWNSILKIFTFLTWVIIAFIQICYIQLYLFNLSIYWLIFITGAKSTGTVAKCYKIFIIFEGTLLFQTHLLMPAIYFFTYSMAFLLIRLHIFIKLRISFTWILLIYHTHEEEQNHFLL
jgi:hypothetical protein